MKIEIKNLRLKTVIGIYGWERKIKQPVVINVCLYFDAARAIKSDNIKDTLDYKLLTKTIIGKVNESKFFLLEKLTAMVLEVVMKCKVVKRASVRIDKPGALRFADSVSCELTQSKR